MANESELNHSGHRQRLKRALSENGLLTFSPHEVIELMLYTALPRRDVNELAHRLDDALGGVSGLMKSSVSEIMAAGASENAAITLKAYCDCANAYISLYGAQGDKLINRGDLDRLIKRSDSIKRQMYLLSSAREIIFGSDLPDNDITRFIFERALSLDAAGCVIICSQSNQFEDAQIFEIRDALGLIEVKLDFITTP